MQKYGFYPLIKNYNQKVAINDDNSAFLNFTPFKFTIYQNEVLII